MIVERCWRLNYERAFHLDILPTILNSRCANGGELVPDKSLKMWKPTNPQGYKVLFGRRCQLQPRFRFNKTSAADTGIRADIEAFPSRKARKGILQRIVQLLKRHRDIMFQYIAADVAPISIIITTLAAQSYEFCVSKFGFEAELDVAIDVIRLMPHFIERPVVHGRVTYSVPNETTQGENFAERWNSEPQRAKSFSTGTRAPCVISSSSPRSKARTSSARASPQVSAMAPCAKSWTRVPTRSHRPARQRDCSSRRRLACRCPAAPAQWKYRATPISAMCRDEGTALTPAQH